MASSLMSIPDHLKSEIFVRLPEPEDLARTAATCVTIRRVVADGSFRCRFRLLHAPPPPSSASSTATAFIPALTHAADFSLSFLPSHRRWAVQDVRDGRVLLAANPEPQVFTELMVCDPLHNRHILLPQLPHDLGASLEFPVRCQLLIASPGAGVNEAAAAMEEAARAFIVVMIAHCQTGPAALVFSSTTRQWRAAASKGWDDLFPNQEESTMISSMHRKLVGCHYAYGCFYLESEMNKKLLVFDTRRMEFSILDVPRETSNMLGLAIVEAGEGRLGMLDIHDETLGGKCDLCNYIRGNIGESSSQWKIQKTISLPYDYQYYIQASTERYLLLRKLGPLQSISSSLEMEYVSMDVKTLQLERVCGVSFGVDVAVGAAAACSACSAADGGTWMLGQRTQEEAVAVEETTFRVIWFVHSNMKVYILFFSSSPRQWRAAASQGLTDLLTGEGQLTMITPQHPLLLGHYYACGCVYWKWMTNERWKKLLVLDNRRMEFSIADLPLEAWNMADIAIVEAGEDMLGLSGIRDEFEGILCYMVGRKQGENYSYQHCIRAATGRYLLLKREEGSLFRCLGLDPPNMEHFSLDVDTLHLESVWCKPILSGISRTHLYTNFPPPLLSSPTI
ncbi:hypothetical protein VPH35_132618 [Triticum aestivum]